MADDNTATAVPVEPGDIASTAMLSPCVGGLMRTWTESGATQLWSVPNAEFLLANQGTGVLSRTCRSEGSFQEAGMLVEGRQTLMLRQRFPAEQDADGTMSIPGYMISLEPPREPAESAFDDFIQLLTQAMTYAQAAGEALIVAIGGWEPPPGPYCLFVETEQQGVRMNTFQTAPPPEGSEWLWSSEAAVVEGPRVTLRLPAGPEALEQGPWLMMDAIYRWGLAPWDLVLTFMPTAARGASG